jgi:molecular chaperone GrpE (heat shock protein)
MIEEKEIKEIKNYLKTLTKDIDDGKSLAAATTIGKLLEMVEEMEKSYKELKEQDERRKKVINIMRDLDWWYMPEMSVLLAEAVK